MDRFVTRSYKSGTIDRVQTHYQASGMSSVLRIGLRAFAAGLRLKMPSNPTARSFSKSLLTLGPNDETKSWTSAAVSVNALMSLRLCMLALGCKAPKILSARRISLLEGSRFLDVAKYRYQDDTYFDCVIRDMRSSNFRWSVFLFVRSFFKAFLPAMSISRIP